MVEHAVMYTLSSCWQSENSYPEDRGFWWLLFFSVLLHFFVLNPRFDKPQKTGITTPKRHFSVSLLPVQHRVFSGSDRNLVVDQAPVKQTTRPDKIRPHQNTAVVTDQAAKQPPRPETPARLKDQVSHTTQQRQTEPRYARDASFRATLLKHIEASKFYPAAARRRGIAGSVDVSFVLLADGQIQSLQVQGGPGLLQNVARRVVRSAVPMPIPDDAHSLPMPIHFVMHFALTD